MFRFLFVARMWGGYSNSHSNVWQLDFWKCQNIDYHWKKHKWQICPEKPPLWSLERILSTGLSCLMCEISTFHTWENWDLVYLTQNCPAYVCLLNFKSYVLKHYTPCGQKKRLNFLVPLSQFYTTDIFKSLSYTLPK